MGMTKVNKLVKVFVLALLVLNIPSMYSQSEGEERVGQAGAYELLINPWARSSGLASANTASVRGIESVFLNVAGLTGTNATEIMFSHASWFADISISSFAVGQKVGDTGVMGISFMSLDFGEIVRTTEQNPNGGLGTFSPQFMNVALSYAKKFTNRISGGVTLRLVSESAAEIAANGFAFDTGIHYETGSRNQAKFGIALKNIGTGMAFNGDGDDVTLMGESFESTFEIRSENFELPALLHIGGSYDFLFNDIHTVMLCLNFTSNSFAKAFKLFLMLSVLFFHFVFNNLSSSSIDKSPLFNFPFFSMLFFDASTVNYQNREVLKSWLSPHQIPTKFDPVTNGKLNEYILLLVRFNKK